MARVHEIGVELGQYAYNGLPLECIRSVDAHVFEDCNRLFRCYYDNPQQRGEGVLS